MGCTWANQNKCSCMWIILFTRLIVCVQELFVLTEDVRYMVAINLCIIRQEHYSVLGVYMVSSIINLMPSNVVRASSLYHQMHRHKAKYTTHTYCTYTVHIHMNTHTYTHTYTHIHARMHKHTHTDTHKHTNTHIHTHTHAHTHTHIYITGIYSQVTPHHNVP